MKDDGRGNGKKKKIDPDLAYGAGRPILGRSASEADLRGSDDDQR